MSYYDHAIDTARQQKPRELKNWELEKQAAEARLSRQLHNHSRIYLVMQRLKTWIPRRSTGCPAQSYADKVMLSNDKGVEQERETVWGQ